MDLFCTNPLENVYILGEILDHLPVTSVKICRLVNSTWNTEATKTLKKTFIYLSPGNTDTDEDMEYFHHPNIFLDDPIFYKDDEENEKFLSSFIFGIKYLKLRLSSDNNKELSHTELDMIQEIFTVAAPTLGELFYDVVPDYSKLFPKTLSPYATLDKVHSLKFSLYPPPMDGNSADLFRSILEVMPNLKTLKIETHHSLEVYAEVMKNYADSEKGSSFVARLQKLCIADDYREHNRICSFLSIPFKLMELRIDFLDIDEGSPLLEFMNQQGPTLRKLKMEGTMFEFAVNASRVFVLKFSNIHDVFPKILCKIPKRNSCSGAYANHQVILPKKLYGRCTVQPISSLPFNVDLTIGSLQDYCPKFRFYLN